MDEKQFKEPMTKMDPIVRLLALNLVNGTKVQKKQIMTLDSFGLGPSEIAHILDTTPNTVNVALSRARKKKKKLEREESHRKSCSE